MDMLTRKLGKDYEARLLNLLLHRAENKLLEVNLRSIGKEFGWSGKAKYLRQALDQMAAEGKVKRITYQTGMVHWALADKTASVTLQDKDGYEWIETSVVPEWIDTDVWGNGLVDMFNNELNVVQKPVKLVKAEVV